MRALFTFIYECLCGKNQNIPEFRSMIYSSVGLLTLTCGLAFALLFYLVLGRWRNVWHTRIHWVVTVILAAPVGFFLAHGIAMGIIGSLNSYIVLFSFMNALLIVIYFTVFSLLLKRFSIYSKRTPF